jgi:RNA ligase (TIGR02306 family)
MSHSIIDFVKKFDKEVHLQLEKVRKLSTVEKILDVQPVINSDNLDVVKIRGWNVVTKRGEFQVGDLCVYFEIDSVLPDVPLFSFMKSKRFRVKTIKLRGQLSQGIIFPLSDIEKQFNLEPFDYSFNVIGTCLDDIIGVKHMDELSPSDPMYVKSTFPSFIKKTDQERIQNMRFSDIVDKEYEVTQKLDGSSMTVFYNRGQYGVCSKNQLLADEDQSHFTKTADSYLLQPLLREYCLRNRMNIAIQGELVGEGIQKNHEKIKGHDFYIYNVFDIDVQEYFTPEERQHVIESLRLKSVPKIFDTPFLITDEIDKDYIINIADGSTLLYGTIEDVQREGLVFKSTDGQTSFKAISNKYLLKNG